MDRQCGEIALPKPVITEIPVLYEGEDIGEIARIEKKTVDEIIRIHSQSDYFVYMLGFAPGHPYTARFEHPFSFRRRESPRVRIAGEAWWYSRGSAILYPLTSPAAGIS